MATPGTASCYAVLATIIIIDAVEAARDGDLSALAWLTFSDRVQLFCDVLDINHDLLLDAVDNPPSDIKRTWIKAHG